MQGVEHGYLWQSGKFTTIDYPGAPQVPYGGSGAAGINDRGDIVGVYIDKNGFQHVYRRARPAWCAAEDDAACKVVYTSIDVPGAAQTSHINFEFGPGLGTASVGINNPGSIVGLYATHGRWSNGFLLANGIYSEIDDHKSDHTAGNGSTCFAINDEGTAACDYQTQDGPGAARIVHGFLYRDTDFTPVFVPGSTAGGLGTQINGINSSKWVVGVFSNNTSPLNGLIWINGTFFTLNWPGALGSEVHSINGRGDITGGYYPNEKSAHGFVGFRKTN